MLASVEAAARKRRHELLLRHLRAFDKPPEILDLGGTIDYWRTVDYPVDGVRRVVLLNLEAQAVEPPFESIVGDACDLSRYGNGEFDIVFSNSVLGHVGDFERQLQMAAEVRRVGKVYVVQTPNHWFPVDWRTLVPFFHWLPPSMQAWCFLRFAVGRYPRAACFEEANEWATRIRNIRREELAELFPGATVVPERILGLNKSFVVHNFEPTPCAELDVATTLLNIRQDYRFLPVLEGAACSGFF